MPFELVFPWDGTWDSVPAAHAAAITFDLLTIVGLMLLGTTLRPGRGGRELGLALAFARAAYPFSLLALQENTNDLMVAAFLVLALAALRSAPGRGILLGLARRRSSRRLRSRRCSRAGRVTRGPGPRWHLASPARRSAWS